MTAFTLSLKILNDGFNSEKYTDMDKTDFQNLARNRPSQNFQFLLFTEKSIKKLKNGSKSDKSCSNAIYRAQESHNLHFPLLANSGQSATLTVVHNPKNAITGYVCNCDDSFNVRHIQNLLKTSESSEKFKEEPVLGYEVDIEIFPDLRIPHGITYVWLLVSLSFIGATCVKLYEF